VERDPGPDVQQPMRRLNPTMLALIAGVAVLILIIAFFATNRNPNQDKLSDQQVNLQQVQPSSAEKRCSNQGTYNLIKRELFRRAALIRGSDQAAFEKLANVAVVRMENAVMESEDGTTGAANCSGSLSLDLPPGAAVTGGQRTLTADVDYTVDSDGNVVLRNADAIVTPLATLTRMEEPAPEAATNEIAPEHLTLSVDEPFDYLEKIRHAGALFLGRYTPPSVADYIAGPNHVLPTGATARFFSALSVHDYTKISNIVHYTKEELNKVKDHLVRLAHIEGFDAHAKSAQSRFS